MHFCIFSVRACLNLVATDRWWAANRPKWPDFLTQSVALAREDSLGNRFNLLLRCKRFADNLRCLKGLRRRAIDLFQLANLTLLHKCIQPSWSSFKVEVLSSTNADDYIGIFQRNRLQQRPDILL